MGISVYPPASGGTTTRTLKQKVFNSSGTWTYPTSSKFDGTVEVTCVGGGGAGGAAFQRASVNSHFLTGGGGGGQVVLRRQLSVLDAGNQTVTIGEGGGGYRFAGGLFGHPSTFGSGYIRNLYPDPAMTKGVYRITQSSGGLDYPESYNNAANASYTSPELWTSGTNPPQPPAGNTYVPVSLSTNAPAYSQYFSVKASTSYRTIYSHSFFSSGGVSVSAAVIWFNVTGEAISTSSLTGFTTQSSSGTWTAVTNTITSPAGAAYGRFRWISTGAGSSFMLNGIQIAETAANVTTVAYGGASGYAWTGQPDFSYTINESETLVAAQGGGGGWGYCLRVTSSGNSFYLPGHASYTSGGLSHYYSGSPGFTNQIISGNGGGAGGSAYAPEFLTQTATASTIVITAGSAFRTYTDNNGEAYPWHYGLHYAAAYTGSPSYEYNNGANNLVPFAHFGGNGEGIEGYGYGGIGVTLQGTSTYGNIYRSSGGINPNLAVGQNPANYDGSALNQAAFFGRPNSGNGGHGFRYNTSSSSGQVDGARGGSGVVIVRWYE